MRGHVMSCIRVPQACWSQLFVQKASRMSGTKRNACMENALVVEYRCCNFVEMS